MTDLMLMTDVKQALTAQSRNIQGAPTLYPKGIFGCERPFVAYTVAAQNFYPVLAYVDGRIGNFLGRIDTSVTIAPDDEGNELVAVIMKPR